jgi:hypothetical protein
MMQSDPKGHRRALRRATGWSVARDPHDGAVYPPTRLQTGIVCWYQMLGKADQILEELQSVLVTVDASSRARQV